MTDWWLRHIDRVRVPGPRGGRVEPPHVLTITDLDGGVADGEKAWSVEHPPECPLATRWWPGAREAFVQDALRIARDEIYLLYPAGGVPIGVVPTSAYPFPGERQCLMQYELDANGLDSLDGHGFIDQPPEPLDRHPFTPDWQRLPEGRYEILAWHEVGFTGEAYESDGGIVVVCRLPKPPKVVLSL